MARTSLRNLCLIVSLSLCSCDPDSVGSDDAGTPDDGAATDALVDHTAGEAHDAQSETGDATDAGSSDASDATGARDEAGFDRSDGSPEAGDASATEGDAGTADAVAGDEDAATGEDAMGAAVDSGGDGTGGAGGTTCAGCTFTTIPMDGTQLVYDSSRGLLYATSSAQAVVNPNTLTVVDLASATVTANIPIGMDPNPLALSDDDSTLWVGLSGDGAIRKVTLGSGAPTLGALQPVPPEIPDGASASLHVTDLAVFPGSPTTVAASVTSDLGGTWVSVFDDGVARPMNGSSVMDRVSRVAVGPPGYVFGYDNISSAFTLSVYGVDATGATLLSANENLIQGFLGFLLYDRSRLFSFYGEVVDVSTPTQPVRAGLFPYSGAIAVRDASHVFMLSTLSLPYTLRQLDSTTFTQVASVALPADLPVTTSNFNDLVYIGGDEFVFFVNDVNNSQAVCIAHLPPLVSTP